MGFCSVADLEAYLQIAIPASKLGSAERAIDEATATIRNYCRQWLELVEDDQVTLDCLGGTKLLLPELPVIDVSSVVEDGKIITATTGYRLGASGILHRIGTNWTRGVQIVTVIYSHGYRLTDGAVGDLLPEDIVQVCVRAATRAYQAGLRAEEAAGVPGLQATSLGDYSVQFGSEQAGGSGEAMLGASAARMLLLSEKDLLNRYRV